MTRTDVAQSLAKIMVLRLNILPPYCYDEDEGEKDDEDYLEFYSQVGPFALEAVTKYREALQELRKDPTSAEALNDLLLAREQFIRGFPFCHDELQDLAPAERAEFDEALEKFYQTKLSPHGTEELLKNLAEYKRLSESILDAL